MADLLADGEPSVTAAQGYELIELARIAAEDAVALDWLHGSKRVGSEWARQLHEQRPFRRAFAIFLQRYGHRGVYESYLRNPSWREAPDYLLDVIVSLIGTDAAARRRRQREAAEAAARALGSAGAAGGRHRARRAACARYARHQARRRCVPNLRARTEWPNSHFSQGGA
jgi:pyruvate,water dikinase